MRVSEVLQSLGRPVVYHANLARALGSIPAALMLAQLLHWQDRSQDPDGWVYKVEADWEAELAFTSAVVKSARSRLVELGLIEHKRRGLPAKPYYRVRVDSLESWWGSAMAVLTGENHPTGPALSPQPDGSNQPVIPLLSKDNSKEDTKEGPRPRDLFWQVYPPRDGKKLGKAKALALFDKLSLEDQRAAYRGALNLRRGIEAGGRFGPKDPERWLKGREWEDWQEPAVVQADGQVRQQVEDNRAAALWSQAKRASEESCPLHGKLGEADEVPQDCDRCQVLFGRAS